MVVAVDTLFLSKKFKYTGTGVYLSHLLSECLRIAEAEEPGITFHGFAPPGENWATNGFASPYLRLTTARILAWRRLWLLGGMAAYTGRVGADVVFLPTAHHSFPGRSVPAVTTILDTIPQRVPESMGRHKLPLHAMTWLNAKLASKIITISAWSKQDLVEIYGVDPGKIEVTYLGYDKCLFNDLPVDPGVSAALLDRWNIRRPFVLHHGMVQLRKNVHGLIRAWDQLLKNNKGLDMQLVLAGPMGLGHEEILRVREASPHRGKIILTGSLPDAELAQLVKSASLCVIPSLYEGFCLPMIEAMACGVPTVASKASCMPEISGNALEYFNPLSTEEMAEVMRRALEDSERRNRLREDGLARAAQFSWQRCARETMRIFTEASANG